MENSIKFDAQNYSSTNLIQGNKNKCANISIHMTNARCFTCNRRKMKTTVLSNNRAFVTYMIVLHSMDSLDSHKK